jgi:hypothetical protein
MNDANGYEIDLRERGLRLCEHCNLVMSEGWYGEPDYACSDHCMEAQRWVVFDLSIGHDGVATYLTRFNLGLLGLPENEDLALDAVYWTDWHGTDVHDDAAERLMSAPYGYDHEAMHLIGGHDEQSEAECNHCRQLFSSTHDEAVTEALQNEHMEVL